MVTAGGDDNGGFLANNEALTATATLSPGGDRLAHAAGDGRRQR